jgi:hypothetical protein
LAGIYTYAQYSIFRARDFSAGVFADTREFEEARRFGRGRNGNRRQVFAAIMAGTNRVQGSGFGEDGGSQDMGSRLGNWRVVSGVAVLARGSRKSERAKSRKGDGAILFRTELFPNNGGSFSRFSLEVFWRRDDKRCGRLEDGTTNGGGAPTKRER